MPENADTERHRPLDERALAHTLRRMACASEAPWLHREVARRMAERLPVFRQQPREVLDWWAVLGGGGVALAEACPGARIQSVERDTVGTEVAAWWALQRWWPRAAPSVVEARVPAAQAQMVWCNMGLHLNPKPQAVMRGWHQALAVDGVLMFSTLGPGTLASLTALYARAGWPTPLAPFVDMHDLGDMLVGAGFADPVMDQETVTLTWADPQALLQELRTLGANFAEGRWPGLRTPRWRDRLLQRLADSAGPDGRPALQFEVVYGHAVKPPPRPRLAGETTVSLDEMRVMMRAGRRPLR